MKEAFLHFVWQHQYFESGELITCQKNTLRVLDPGKLNKHSGPDFIQGRIMLDGLKWVGSIEIHLRSSDWYRHQHHKDPGYDQVILHVVWVNDAEVSRRDGRKIPALELKNRIPVQLILGHHKLIHNRSFIPCAKQLNRVSGYSFYAMLDSCIELRMDNRSRDIQELLNQNNHHWDLTTYQLTGRNFGFNINADVFEQLTRIVPLNLVRKHRSHLWELEALFFGQAGLLQGMSTDRYFRGLQKEHEYLTRKYDLPPPIRKEQWRFLRLRPANFPTMRIAQFSAFMQAQGFRFSNFKEVQSIKQIRSMSITPSRYWQQHYDFGKKWPSARKFMGKSSLESLGINTVVPLLAAYSSYTRQPKYHDTAMELLRKIPAESNRITSYWKAKGFKVSSAYYSQALIELNNHFCNQKRCLECSIGASILKKNPP